MKTSLLSLLVAFACASAISAQDYYPTNYYLVQQDAQPFFFESSEFSPMQTGAYSDLMGQFSQHRLSAVHINPANIDLFNSRGYAYVDVKTTPKESKQNMYCEVCDIDYSGNLLQPNFQQRKIDEPIMSAAFFLNPFGRSQIRLGFTYQLLRLNESFYQVASGDGFANLESDFGVSNFADPTGDFFADTDRMNKYGHFPSLYAGYKFSDRVSAGLKVSYNSYLAEGGQLTENFGSGMPSGQVVQLSQVNRQRTVDYHHWDVSGGLKYVINQNMSAGISAGYLTGDFDQTGLEQNYSNTLDQGDTYFYESDSEFQRRNGYKKDGDRMYANAEFYLQPQNDVLFKVIYRGSKLDQNLNLGQLTARSSENDSYYEESDGTTIRRITENSFSENGEGVGDVSAWNHRLAIGLTKDLPNDFQLRSGLQFQVYRHTEHLNQISESMDDLERNTITNNTDESTLMVLTNSRDQQILETQLNRFVTYLPVFLKRTFSRSFSAELGVIADYRKSTLKLKGSNSTEVEMTEFVDGVESFVSNSSVYPVQDRNKDSQTYLNGVASLIFSPTNQLNLRFMAFSDRRDINSYRTIDSFRFQLMAEISF